MFQKIDIKNFEAPENSAVFNADIFVDCYKRNSKFYPYSIKIVKSICDGNFDGIITDLELGKFRRIANQTSIKELFYEKIKKNSKCLFYEVMIANCLSEYEKIPAYHKLFALCRDTNLHWPDLTSVITAIETDRPLITNDFHHWQQQNNIIRAYRERYAEKRAKELIEGKKVSEMKMYDSKDFCKLVLHL
ncbi:MAG: hypothetical protein QXK49_00645 [Candidatus Aenigmatarchaeota archaeon]